jgi:hypothetical protein
MVVVMKSPYYGHRSCFRSSASCFILSWVDSFLPTAFETKNYHRNYTYNRCCKNQKEENTMYSRTISEEVRESRIRRKAQSLGYRLHKSRVKKPHGNDLGGYQLLCAPYGGVVFGERFELCLTDVQDYLLDVEAEQRRGNVYG